MNKNLLAASAATLAIALTVASCGNASDPKLNQIGATPDLPKVNETLVPAMKISPPAGWNGETPTVPQGFTISAFATDLKIPRQMLVLPNGDVLIAEGRGGHAPPMRPKDVIAGVIKKQGNTKIAGGNRITLVRDANNDGVPELRTVLVENLDAPYGLAYVDGYLYVAEQGALVRFAFQPGQTGIATSPERVTELPSRINHHWTKSLALSADGTKLYVGIGSNSNIGERGMAVEEERAVVWEIDRATGARRTIATGIRNPTALSIEPTTGLLWSVVNERDELGPQLVPDYLTQVRDGAFYGWPYSYWGQNVDPRVMPKNPEMVAKAVAPDYALGSHVAALGIDFARNGGFGGPFANGAFIGMHGSWNRQDPSGYKVAWVPFNAGRPAGAPVDFATGFLKDGKARGRPVGVAFDANKRVLLVADDLSNTVWRIAPAR